MKCVANNTGTILGSEKIDNLNTKTNISDFEARVLIGWVANTLN